MNEERRARPARRPRAGLFNGASSSTRDDLNAFRQGREAAERGESMGACPYDMHWGLSRRAQWLNGWQDVKAAQREARFEAQARALGESTNLDADLPVAHRFSSRGGRL